MSATVSGARNYLVEIGINPNGIEYMSCNCPYYTQGDNCKHLAAVFYALNKSKDEKLKALGVQSDLDATIDLLSSLSHEEVYTFLKEELSVNSALRFKFRTKFELRNKAKSDHSSYLRHIDSVFELHLGRDGFIEYDAVYDFQADIHEIIDSIRGLVGDGEYLTAFAMIKHVTARIDDLPIDDSMGTTSWIMYELSEMVAEIITGSSEPVYTLVFEWLCANVEQGIGEYVEETLIPLFMKYYHEKAKLKAKIEVIDRIITRIENKEMDMWLMSHRLSRWLKHKMAILKDLDHHEQADQLLWQYIHLPEIRDIAVARHIAQKEYDQAIDLLVEGKKLYQHKLPGIASDYSSRLIELYKITDNKEQLLEESRKRLLQYSRDELEVYREYKSLFSHKEWQVERDYILDKLKEAHRDMKIYYAEENLLGELLAEIKKTPHSSDLDTYEELLYNDFAHELRDLFVARVIRMARHTGRGNYQLVKEELERIEKYPDGKRIVDQLKAKWSIQYKNRRVMMKVLGIRR